MDGPSEGPNVFADFQIRLRLVELGYGTGFVYMRMAIDAEWDSLSSQLLKPVLLTVMEADESKTRKMTQLTKTNSINRVAALLFLCVAFPLRVYLCVLVLSSVSAIKC